MRSIFIALHRLHECIFKFEVEHETKGGFTNYLNHIELKQ